MSKKYLILATILLTVISCNSQDVCVYSKPFGDSILQANETLKARITECEKYDSDLMVMLELYRDRNVAYKATIDSLRFELEGCDNFVEVLAEENNQLITLTDALSLENNQLNLTIQTLKSIIERLSNPSDTAVFVQDTIAFKIIGSDNTMVKFNKVGNQINYQISDGVDRINLWYNSGTWQQWFMKGNASWQHLNGQIK